MGKGLAEDGLARRSTWPEAREMKLAKIWVQRSNMARRRETQGQSKGNDGMQGPEREQSESGPNQMGYFRCKV